MADMTSIARPYARAAYEYAKEHQVAKNWLYMLDACVTCIEDPRIMALIDNPQYSEGDVASIIIETLTDVLDQHGVNFVKILSHYKRLLILPEILKLFVIYKSQDERKKTARITLAYEATDQYLSVLKDKLQTRFRCDIELETHIDPEIIGGAVIEVDDTIIDGSLRGRLKNMQNVLQA
ncbi:MAG: F0F1 ATP synthase subunit delta [Francisellaceae bacterium]